VPRGHGSNPDSSDIFRCRPDSPKQTQPPEQMGTTAALTWAKATGCGDEHSAPSRAEVKQKGELCLYSLSPSLFLSRSLSLGLCPFVRMYQRGLQWKTSREI